MFALALALAVAAGAPEFTDEDAYGAIWTDLQRNAWIGSGNVLASLEWYGGHDQDYPPTLHIRELNCTPTRGLQRCNFVLVREPDPKSPDAHDDQAEPARLACRATLSFADGEWIVTHTPPPRRRGHSRTTMRCDKAD